ncbi:uncharacterized protein MELLADRAFT_58814 [Melampsora larici-populina 98AG31]|uniref:Uncharacterized protein n=1 Tax=Melampsora larici-populina (strain 98AG31 / pathotype 3-4-7) TaxID=747676 RepID=F4R2X2_MELLP|nr:uncharacterized protein MELLADRAFT_58814 [Melampsora larici-populina 98AG31]EGG12887.1 hypothetical protein MELLADRAFT_58814 [Melampsora larici-populina 98AG31]
MEGAPDYDEDQVQADAVEPEPSVDTLNEDSFGSKYHTSASRKQANRLNGLISKANFVSRRVARSAAWRRHFSRVAKGMNLKVLPLTPGYNATRWNAEFDSLDRLVKARKIVNKLLADDLALLKSKKRRKGSQKPRGYFHEIFFTPNDWNSLEALTNELSHTERTATLESASSNLKSSDNVFQLFKAQGPEVESNEVAAYIKGTHPMSSKDNARETKAVLSWWKAI